MHTAPIDRDTNTQAQKHTTHTSSPNGPTSLCCWYSVGFESMKDSKLVEVKACNSGLTHKNLIYVERLQRERQRLKAEHKQQPADSRV